MSTAEYDIESESEYATAIALVGMSGRFPGADSVQELWSNLRAGIAGLRELTDEEMRDAGVEPGLLADPRYVRIGGPLNDIAGFDAALFGISPREAETMDPQHRLFLECAWEALESAGYCPTEAPGQVAVFGGVGFPDYIMRNARHIGAEPGGMMLLATGNERDSLANYVSYKLGLRGPAIGVQTFCSTSLVAVHLACQSLLTFECDMALAGGAHIPLPQPAGYRYEQGGITSPDGVVRSFDAEANGTVLASGVGVVALKRFSEAVAEGDVIHAVILGSAVNNDGRARAGYTAPGVDGQAEVIGLALGTAGVKPDSVGYVECHATGTVLGDSIELAAMTRAFAGSRRGPAVLGTLKASLGHLDRASGVTALIRAALAVEHGVLPGMPRFKTPNSALASAAQQFTVLTEDAPWPVDPTPRRAGVNSFGLGGTNAHVVLEQPPARPASAPRPGPHLLAFSALNEAALEVFCERLRSHLATNPDLDMADVAFTLQKSRGGFAQRRAVVARNRDEALTALADPGRWIDGRTRRRNPAVRLVAPDVSVPAAWWTQLRAALGASGADGRAETIAALAAWLSEAGVRTVGAADDADEEVVVAPPGTDSADEWLLAVLARLWQAGSPIAWDVLHGGRGRRVQLPTYPFQRRRFWLQGGPSSAAPTTGRTYDLARWTYLPTHRPASLPVAGLEEKVRRAGPWLVFSGDERGEALIARLTAAGADVTAVRPGDAFAHAGSAAFTVRTAESADMIRLLSALPSAPRAIVHAFSLAGREADPDDDPIAHFEAEQDRGFHSVLALATALIDDAGAAPRADLVLLTSGAVGVTAGDLRRPEHSTLVALAPSLTQENPRLRCRAVDVDQMSDAAAEQILAATVGPNNGPVAVRSGESWARVYQPWPTPQPGTGRSPAIRRGDTVMITGGLGDVGLVIGRHLADKYACRLVLTARTELPPRERWQAFLEAVPHDGARAARHIRNILDLEERGADVLAMSADVTDVERMRGVVRAAVKRFGRIDVVLHGAGVQDPAYFDYAHCMTRSACQAHMDAKVWGFHVLQEVLADQALDRRITLSSLAAVLGGTALGPYGAANAALDAYVRQARARGQGRWVTVNWDTWHIDSDRLEVHGPGVVDYAMTPGEAVEIFERALAAADRVGHLTVSTGSLDHRIAQWVTGDPHETGDRDGGERHPRPDLNSPYVAPKEGTETVLADIWSQTLGIAPIGVADNFFELGGHSLAAVNLTARIRKALGAAIPITGLLQRPTIRQLAEIVDAAVAVGAATGSDRVSSR